nr:hypothetical protein [uncultured Noviherbaspirillum sp.]
MDTHTVGRRNTQVIESSSSSDSVSESGGNNIDGTDDSAFPKPTNNSPRVLSGNRAAGMFAERGARVDEPIHLKDGIVEENGLGPASLNAKQLYLMIQTDLKKAIDGESSRFDKYPGEKDALLKANKILETLINADIDYYKDGLRKELLTASSGALSYLLTFCTGTLLASALNTPLLSPLVIGICWTLCERFPPMMRATSWSNTHADVSYPDIMYMAMRSSQDWVRQLAGLNPKKFIRDGKVMTAFEILKEYEVFRAWAGKVLSDDLPSHTFTLTYIIRNVSLRLLPDPGFLATLPGKAVSLGSLAFAGLCAGGTAALGFQGIRGCQYKAAHPLDRERGETLVKSREIWKAEFEKEKAKYALAEKYLEEAKVDIEQGNLEAVVEKTARVIAFMKADMDKAIEKSEFWRSLLYEFLCLFRGKTLLGESDSGEVAGKLRQTISGFFAKIGCLMPSALFSTFVLPAFASSNDSLTQQLGLLILSPIILILGFGLRKELEIIVSAIMGLVAGVMDVLSFKKTGKDKYKNTLNPGAGKTPAVRNPTGIGGGTPGTPMKFPSNAEDEKSQAVKVDFLSVSSSEDEV